MILGGLRGNVAAMSRMPVAFTGGRAYFTEGVLAYAGHWVHDAPMEDHTHNFVEVAVVTGGDGVHRSLAGRQPLGVGDVVFLRPGVWHGYDTRHLELYNCCFSAELLHRELAWTREDPLLGYLLWTGPLSMERRGTLATTLDLGTLQACQVHLDALDRLRFRPLGLHRSDIISHLTLVLGHVARAVAADRDRVAEPTGPTHPAVVQAMRLLESDLTRRWTLGDLADQLHLSAGYLLRLFRSSTGMPPMAYLARRRVETAAGLLLHTDQPVTQIGRGVGWPDQNYFARRFKAHFGMSATTYRGRFADSTRQLRTWRGTGQAAHDRPASPV
jgi:AraC family transcriptional regulator, L-rhamnose operon transcriptional activator RhaR